MAWTMDRISTDASCAECLNERTVDIVIYMASQCLFHDIRSIPNTPNQEMPFQFPTLLTVARLFSSDPAPTSVRQA